MNHLLLIPKMASQSATLNASIATRGGITRPTAGLKAAVRKAKGLKVNSTTALRKEQLWLKITSHG